MWPLINENKQELNKKGKKAKLCNTCFFSKKNYLQRHEGHELQKEKIDRFVHSSKKNP